MAITAVLQFDLENIKSLPLSFVSKTHPPHPPPPVSCSVFAFITQILYGSTAEYTTTQLQDFHITHPRSHYLSFMIDHTGPNDYESWRVDSLELVIIYSFVLFGLSVKGQMCDGRWGFIAVQVFFSFVRFSIGLS